MQKKYYKRPGSIDLDADVITYQDQSIMYHYRNKKKARKTKAELGGHVHKFMNLHKIKYNRS